MKDKFIVAILSGQKRAERLAELLNDFFGSTYEFEVEGANRDADGVPEDYAVTCEARTISNEHLQQMELLVTGFYAGVGTDISVLMRWLEEQIFAIDQKWRRV